MSEIIAKLSLNDEKFARGLANSESKWRAFTRRVDEIKAAKAAGAVLPDLPEVEKKATGIIGLLRRKFSSADLFKDTLRGLGVGLGVGGIANAVAEQFAHAAESAKALASHTGDLYQTTLRLIGVAGGPTRELQLQGRQVKELNRDIDNQRKLVASFSLMDKLRNPQMILEQEQALYGLIQKQADLAAQIDITVIEENRRTEALQRQQQLTANLNAAELRHAGDQEKIAIRIKGIQDEINAARKQGALPSTLQALYAEKQTLEEQSQIVARNHRERMDDLGRQQQLNEEIAKAELSEAGEMEKKQIRLNALRREYKAIVERKGIGSTEAEENRNEQRRTQNQIAIDQKKAARDSAAAVAGLGADLAGRSPDRVPGPRPRGRSERERIADRGRGFVQQAEEAIRTGRSPEYVAKLAGMANRDLTAAGNKVGESTSKVDPKDAGALGSELIKANKTLEQINKNLTPKGVK